MEQKLKNKTIKKLLAMVGPMFGIYFCIGLILSLLAEIFNSLTLFGIAIFCLVGSLIIALNANILRNMLLLNEINYKLDELEKSINPKEDPISILDSLFDLSSIFAKCISVVPKLKKTTKKVKKKK